MVLLARSVGLPDGRLAMDRASPFASGVRLLIAPDYTDVPISKSGGKVHFARNLAHGVQSFNPTTILENTTREQPYAGRSAWGRVWDFNRPGTNQYLFLSNGATPNLPWRPFNSSGYEPATFAAVYTAFSDGALAKIFSQAASTREFGIGLRGSNTISGTLNAGTSIIVTATISYSDDPWIVIFTTRSRTDHELYARNLRSGEVVGATSSTDCGTSATSTSNWRNTIGMWDNGSQSGDFFSRGYIHWVGGWGRGMAAGEMEALAQSPFALFKPERTQRAQIITGATAEIALTEDDDTLDAAVIVSAVANLSVTEADDDLESSAVTTVVADLTMTEDDDVIEAAATQVGDGVIADLLVAEDDDALDALGLVQPDGDLAVTEEDDVLVAYAISGSVGPFAPRPFLWLN